jgi:hypothetical protein
MLGRTFEVCVKCSGPPGRSHYQTVPTSSNAAELARDRFWPGLYLKQKMKTQSAFCVAVAILCLASLNLRSGSGASSALRQDTNKNATAVGSAKCTVVGKTELTITCDYPLPSTSRASGIALSHASFWFKTTDDSHLRVSLTFARLGPSTIPIESSRPAYFSIDGIDGRNFVRRPLPNVHWEAINPEKPVTFSGTFIAPALQPGQYAIHLWIPPADPSRKFDTSQAALLGNPGMADAKTGLNLLASFTVTETPGH